MRDDVTLQAHAKVSDTDESSDKTESCLDSHCFARPHSAMAAKLTYTPAGPLRMARIVPDCVTHADVEEAPKRGLTCFGGTRSAPSCARVTLSPLDTFLFVRLLQPCVAFFFEQSIDDGALFISLGRTLRRFPILAGRLRPAERKKGQFDVELCDAGVPFQTCVV